MSELYRRLKMLLGRRRWQRELQEEMALHRELRADERRFGNELRLRERSQDIWGWSWWEAAGQDLRLGLRRLRRAPLATGLALLSLALGIGATTALFSLMNAIMLRSLPVSHPEQLVHVMMQLPKSQHLLSSFSNPIWEQLRDQQQAFSGAFAWNFTQVPMRSGGQQQQAAAVEASGGYFATLGVVPEAGRAFGAEVDRGPCPHIAVLSDAFWQSHFARSPAALGSTLTLANQDFQIIGVAPRGFFGMDVGTQFDVILPLCAQAVISPRNMLQMRDAWWLEVAGRLKSGETMAQAEAQLQARMPGWLQASLPAWSDRPQLEQNFLSRHLRLQPLAGGVSYLRGNYQLPLEILLGVAGLVLLVACANLAGLMLAQSAARKDETATRLALGASRARLIRQMLTESLSLAVAGAALGALLAAWACRWLEDYWSTQALAIHLHLAPDARVLGFALAVTLATAVLFGLPAALRSTDSSHSARGRTVTGHTGHHMAAVQVAVSIVLIAGAGLFLRSFVNLARVNLGFDPAQVTVVRLGMTGRHESSRAGAARQARDLEALRQLPGVEAISESFIVPTAGMQWDAALAARATSLPDVCMNAVSPGYFAALQVPLVAGRDFRATDATAAPAVVILSQSAARGLFPEGNALGQQVELPHSEEVRPSLVVGIAADAKYDSSLRRAAPPTAYYPLAQLLSPFPTTSYELRSALPLAAMQPAVRAALAQADPDANVTIGTLEAVVANTLKPERLLALLSVLFGGLALLLTAIGLYGMAAYNANRRRREFGVRMALGARPIAVVKLALAEQGRTLALGVIAGLGLAWAGARLLQAALGKLLFGLQAADGITLTAAAAVLVAVALFAAWLPARRAARADPLTALREE